MPIADSSVGAMGPREKKVRAAPPLGMTDGVHYETRKGRIRCADPPPFYFSLSPVPIPQSPVPSLYLALARQIPEARDNQAARRWRGTV